MPTHEWSVLATDSVLAVACLVFAWRIHRRVPRDRESSYLVAASLGVLAVAALIGGFRHGFGPDLAAETYVFLVKAAYVGIMMSGGLLTWGVLRSQVASKDLRDFWRVSCMMKFLLFSTLYVADSSDVFVVADWLATMYILLIVGLDAVRTGTVALGVWLWTGTGVSILAGVVQYLAGGQTLHNDLCHLLMVPAMYAYSRAAVLLRNP